MRWVPVSRPPRSIHPMGRRRRRSRSRVRAGTGCGPEPGAGRGPGTGCWARGLGAGCWARGAGDCTRARQRRGPLGSRRGSIHPRRVGRPQVNGTGAAAWERGICVGWGLRQRWVAPAVGGGLRRRWAVGGGRWAGGRAGGGLGGCAGERHAAWLRRGAARWPCWSRARDARSGARGRSPGPRRAGHIRSRASIPSMSRPVASTVRTARHRARRESRTWPSDFRIGHCW